METDDDDQVLVPDIENLWLHRDYDTLETLIKCHGIAREIRVNQVPLLLLACRDGPISLVKTLLEAGASHSSCDFQSRTSLYIACEKGRLDVVEILLQHGGDVYLEYVDDSKRTPLRIAFENGHLGICQLLLSRGADVTTKDSAGFSLLHVACIYTQRWWMHNVSLVNLLVPHGIECDTKDQSGRHPLHHACINGNLEAISWLLDRRCDINTTNDDGDTPLCLTSSLWHQWWQNQMSVVKLLLLRGAQINKANNEGHTPFHLACAQGAQDLVEFLMSQGATIDSRDKKGNTPLQIACGRGHVPTVEFLLNKKAEVDSLHGGESSTFTPLHAACRGRQPQVVELLLMRGARIDITNRKGETPMLFSCSMGYADIVEVIARIRRESTQEKTGDGNPLVFFACKKGHLDVVKVLLTQDNSLVIGDSQCLSVVLESGVSVDVKRNLMVLMFSFGANVLPPERLPMDCDSDLAIIATKFPMIFLYQTLRSIYDSGRFRLRKPTMQVRGFASWGLYKVLKTMLQHNISWDLWRVVLRKSVQRATLIQ